MEEENESIEHNVMSVLRQQRDGECLDEFQDAVSEALEASLDLGKASKVILELRIEPKANGTISLHDEVKKTIPKPAKSAQTWFHMSDPNLCGTVVLQKRNPNQPDLSGIADFEAEEAAKRKAERERLKRESAAK